jgi:hypothetical protein
MTLPVDGSHIEQSIQQINSGGMMAPRADIKPGLFDTAIFQKGYRILWEQGMFCSCYIKESEQPDYNCNTCKGKGYLYFGAKQIRAVVTSINGHKDQHRIGLDEVGSAYMTPQSTDDIGFRDRFTFLDFTTRFSEILTRDVDGEMTKIDKLRYPAKDIVMVRKLDQEFKRGLHFDLAKDGKTIEWYEDYLYEGDRYSILYTTNPVYISIGPIHELRGTYSMAKAGGLEAFHQLPKQFQIKREDFLENE